MATVQPDPSPAGNPLTTSASPGQPPKTRKNMLVIGVLVIAVGLLMLAFACTLLAQRLLTQGSGSGFGPARVGSKMQDFTLVDIDGNSVRLSDYAGRPVLMNFWATWCPPCREEMPALNDFFLAQEHTGFVILAIDAGDPEGEVIDFTWEQGLQFPMLLDPSSELVHSLRIRYYPTSIMIGRDGVIQSIHTGMYTPELLERELLPLIEQ